MSQTQVGFINRRIFGREARFYYALVPFTRQSRDLSENLAVRHSDLLTAFAINRSAEKYSLVELLGGAI
jgi:hypothetical protein